MTPKGTREERETIIRWSEVEPIAYIWTASLQTYNALIKRGHFPVREDPHSAWFQVPRKAVRPIRSKESLGKAHKTPSNLPAGVRKPSSHVISGDKNQKDGS